MTQDKPTIEHEADKRYPSRSDNDYNLREAFMNGALYASLNRHGCRWDKNMDVRLKAWIERLLKESGILKHGLHPSVHESHNTFLVSIEETFNQERDKWLSIEPCATSSEIEELGKENAVLKNMNDKLWEALIRNLPQEKLDLIKNALDFLTK